jgi:hypothetical protein
MNNPAARLSIDLEELERQLRQMSGGRAPQNDDPLADLAKLVGQDDPFRDLIARDRPAPTFQPAPVHQVPAEPVVSVRHEPEIEPARPAPADWHDESDFEAQMRGALQDELHGHGHPAPSARDADDAAAFLQAAVNGGRHDVGIAVQAGSHRLGAQDYSEAGYREPATRDDAASPEDMLHENRANDPRLQSFHSFDNELDAYARDDLSRRDPASVVAPRLAGRDDDGYGQWDATAAGMAVAGAAGSAGATGAYAASGDLPEDDGDMQVSPRRSRKGLITVAALLGVATVGVGLAMTLRNSGPRVASGEPPIIQAEQGPMKVQPQNPGGVDIPNQNKQIYERPGTATAGPTKVITSAEEPVDVAAAARLAAAAANAASGQAAAPRIISTSPAPIAAPPAGVSGAAAGATPVAPVAVIAPPPSANGSASNVLGEPRRVRTVSVMPDGTIVDPTKPAASQPAATTASAPATAPAAPTMAPPPRPTAPAQPSTPAAAVPSAGAALSAPGGSTVAAAPLRPAAPRPAPAAPANTDGPLSITPASQPKLQQRVTNPTPAPTQVASAAPVAALPAASAPAPAAAATGGGFSVQLAAPGSEAEARSTFASLQRRFGNELGGMQPVIRRADVGDRTIYRLRVGPMSRDEATSLCTRLQGAGGQCFVARN